MRSLFYRLRRVHASAHSNAESVRVVARKDVQWNRPVFKAPSLPTPKQVGHELPVVARFPKKKSHKD
ncbi:MAG TPA: hypothetical protein VNW30_12075 [Opitutaceae bacterium]|jgi:hypothetical protein|nr:hypothetical protein [Opitutaceae bacterium]